MDYLRHQDCVAKLLQKEGLASQSMCLVDKVGEK